MLGALFLGGYYSVIVSVSAANSVNSVSDTATAVTAINQLDSSYTTLTNSLNAWEQATTSCDQNLACVTKEDTKAASAFNTFSGQLANTSVPAGADAEKARLAAAAAASQQDFIQLSKTTSASQYQSTVVSTGLQKTLNGFDADFNALTAKLRTF